MGTNCHGPFSSLVGSKGLTRDIHILGCRRSCRRCFKFQTGKTHKIIQTDTWHDRCEIRKKAGRLTGKREIPHKSGNVETCKDTESTHVLPGPVMEEQVLEVQYSDTTPYIRLICSKNDIAANKHNTCIKVQQGCGPRCCAPVCPV